MYIYSTSATIHNSTIFPKNQLKNIFQLKIASNQANPPPPFKHTKLTIHPTPQRTLQTALQLFCRVFREKAKYVH